MDNIKTKADLEATQAEVRRAIKYFKACEKKYIDTGIWEYYHTAIEQLEQKPNIAYWEKDKAGILHCSRCKKEAYWDTDYGQQNFEFCPYCGAMMLNGE